MKLRKIISSRTGRIGYQHRFRNPVTGKRTKSTLWISDRTKAEKAWREKLDELEAEASGDLVAHGWKMPFADLVKMFLEGAPISSEDRRSRLQDMLTANHLDVRIGADLKRRGKLTSICQTLRADPKFGDEYVRKCVQQPLKQLSAWAAGADLFEYDPLNAWKKLPRVTEAARKRAWSPEEMRAFFAACDALDERNARHGRQYPTGIIFRTLLVTGNRPSAVFRTTVGDLEADRLKMPPGRGKKRNGVAAIVPELHAELSRYILHRGRPAADKPLLVSPTGSTLDIRNIRACYVQAATLAAVKLEWPENSDPLATPFDVMQAMIAGGEVRFDGAPPRTQKSKDAQDARKKAIREVMDAIRARVNVRLDGRPLYSLRKTHRTWAKRFVSDDVVRLQCGWASTEVSERNYLDEAFTNVGDSARAVWDVLTGTRLLKAAAQPAELAQAVGAEVVPNVVIDEKQGQKGTASRERKTVQTVGSQEPATNSPTWIRTRNPVINSHMLYR